MTRQRKTHLLFLALVPAVVFGALRCTDSPSAPRAPSSQAVALEPVTARLAKLHAQYDWIGEFHNDALKYVLANLQRLPAKSLNRRAICETALTAYKEFHRSRRHVEMPAQVAAAAENNCSSSGLGRSVGAFSLEIPVGPKKDELSAEAQSYLDQIVSAIDASDSTADLNASVANIEANAAASLSNAEAGAVVIVGAVTESSAQYWEANFSDWLPYMSTVTPYSLIAGTRLSSDGTNQIGPTGTPRFDFWSDFKAAGKRALGGDARGAIRAVISAGIAGIAFEYDVILAGAATGSIMAVLQM